MNESTASAIIPTHLKTAGVRTRFLAACAAGSEVLDAAVTGPGTESHHALEFSIRNNAEML